jgi:tetratricopeptide (TPR) repeat protein
MQFSPAELVDYDGFRDLSMSKLPAAARPGAYRAQTPLWTRIVVWGVVSFSALGALVVGILMFGNVIGSEFSPNQFDRREYFYYRIPLVRLQVTPVYRNGSTNDLERHIRAQPYIPKEPQSSPRWDVVRTACNGVETGRGDAEILCNYLDSTVDGGQLRWLQWSQQHPNLAKHLWPAVAKLAQQNLYILVPGLFQLAANADTKKPDEFKRRLDATLSLEYQRLGDHHRELEEYEQAVDRYNDALSHDPQRKPALEGRARALRALDRPTDGATPASPDEA